MTLNRSDWRVLVEAAGVYGAPSGMVPAGAFRQAVKAASTWVLPSKDAEDQYLCIALFWAGRAYCAAGAAGDRAAIAPALAVLARLVGEVLDATGPGAAAPGADAPPPYYLKD